MNSIEETIYVNLIDGTNVWIPVKSKKLQPNAYFILEIDEFDGKDTTQLPEFFPGDTVETEEHTFGDGKVGKIAKKLVSPSTFADRKYFDFLYKTLMKKITFDKKTFEIYRQEIARIKNEIADGHFFYPEILKNINEFNQEE